MICHKIGTATENIKTVSFYSFFTMRRKMFITHKNHSQYYNRLGRSGPIIIIYQFVPYTVYRGVSGLYGCPVCYFSNTV